jgi:hypothetical protein
VERRLPVEEHDVAVDQVPLDHVAVDQRGRRVVELLLRQRLEPDLARPLEDLEHELGARVPVRAGADGCRLLTLPSASFEDLLRRSDSFSRSLLSQLALRLVDATRKVAA